MTHKLIFFLVLLLLVGCQKEVLEPTSNLDGSVGFRLKTDDNAIDMEEFQTKGAPHNTLDKYDNVYVNVYSHTSEYEATTNNDVTFFREIELEKEDQKWKYTPSMFWPGTKKLSFLAYASDIDFANAGISFTPSTGTPESITYSVPTDVTKQPDLLVSTLVNQSKVDNVFLTMKHALSCVSFCGDTPQKGVYVKKITLRNVYGTGTLALNSSSIEWQIDTNSNRITVFEAGINDKEEVQQSPTTPNYLMTETGYLMMLPQKLKDAAIDVLYWNGKDDTANKIVTYTLPIDNEAYSRWKPGQKYVYKFGTESDDVTVVYYEKYIDDSYGFFNKTTISLRNDKEIVEAGYGAVSKKSIGGVAGIRLTSPTSAPVTSGTVVKLADDSFLYPVNQSASSTFNLPRTTTPQNVYFNGSAKSCGMIVPHFAKGVYTTVQTAMTTHSIRTPQQMRNITSSDASSARNTHTYIQELNLDFSKTTIGGRTLTTAVVNREFNDLFDGQSKRIENVTMEAFSNGALFQGNSGEIKDVVLANSSIKSSGNTGGIVAVNQLKGVITKPRILGENKLIPFNIEGTTGYVGAIAGYNYGKIIGNTAMETATELPIAEVSGWVSIKGVTATGGITGENSGTLTTCLVYGVHVIGTKKGDVEVAKIKIEGGNYVGGIAGVNKSNIEGNYSYSGPSNTLQAEPDLAGIVSVSGNDFVGGIAGQNSGTLHQVNIRLGRGDADNAMTINGNLSVGGIVGYNIGALESSGTSFISVRGNVRISGVENVGGIVGNNQNGNILNCFVYNFYSQSTTSQLIHYAPKIIGVTNVGGIAGFAGSGEIKQCVVFSTVSNTNANGGNVASATTEIKAQTRSAGGIVGNGFNGLTITASCVLGNVKVDGVTAIGGIVGENNLGTSITLVHIGNSGTEVSDIYDKLFKVVKLPVYDPRMQTNGNVMTITSGTPTIEGTEYLGGICGLNLGTVDAVSIKDNVKIGTPTSTYVGGISGGNGKTGTIKNCQTYNPANNPDASVAIIGNAQVGGIVGLNNGVVNTCQLGLPNLNSSRLITINGGTKLGGIAGSNGGAETGDKNTLIANCNVYGKVLIEATLGDNWGKTKVGGIIGENGQTNRVENCNVIGYTSSGTPAIDHDITLKGYDQIGGIAGANFGDIHGTPSSYCKVTHTAVIASDMYAGGLVGFLQSTADYAGKLYYCDVSQGVLIHYMVITSGAFVGQLDGKDGTIDAPILFGTTLGGITNKIYIGATNPVRINAYDAKVILPPQIEGILPYYPEEPMIPDATTGNLWTRFAPYNYLHYTTYQ